MEKRLFQFIKGTSSKFWEISGKGDTVEVYFGRIGSSGKWAFKHGRSPEHARQIYDKLIAEKTGKGYVEATGAKPAPKAARGAKPKVKAGQKHVSGEDLLARRICYESYTGKGTVDSFVCALVSTAKGLSVRFKEEGQSNDGRFLISTAALKSATGAIAIRSHPNRVEGLVEARPKKVPHPDGGDQLLFTKDTLPILLSRSAFAALKAGGVSLASPWARRGSKPKSLAIVGEGASKLRFDGKSILVPTLMCDGELGEMWVLDDETWPFIIKRRDKDGWAGLLEAKPDLNPRGRVRSKWD